MTPAVVDAAPRSLAVVKVTTRIANWPSEFRHSLDKVYAAVRAGQIQQAGHNVMVYRNRPDGLVDIDCGIDTAGPFDSVGEIVYSTTPTGPAVTATHIGPYHLLGNTHSAIVSWAKQNGHRLAPVCWEIYGDWHEDPAQLRTDIFHLLG
jgi:effector-binding domain-containing protein